MKRLEQISAVCIILLAAAAIFGTSELAFLRGTAPGPRFMPLAVAAVSALLAALLFLDAARRPDDTPVEWPDREGRIRVALTAVAIVAFIAASPWLGLVVGSAVFVLVYLLTVLRRRIVPSVATAVVTALLIQGIFVSWLGTTLPRSVFGI